MWTSSLCPILIRQEQKPGSGVRMDSARKINRVNPTLRRTDKPAAVAHFTGANRQLPATCTAFEMRVIMRKQNPHGARGKFRQISNMGHLLKVDGSGAFKESGYWDWGLNWIGLGTEARRGNPAKVDPHISHRPAAHVVVVIVIVSLFSPREERLF